jgi:signal transduction histidine kinase
VVVLDDGPGFGDPTVRQAGVGLAGTRARLIERYGAACKLELTNGPEGGAMVTIEVPFVQCAP